MSTIINEEAKRVINEEISSLKNVVSKIDHNFTDAVKLICKSHKIVVSGVGKSGMIARKIAATFSSVSISSVFMHPVDALHGDLGMVQQNDTAILLSKSGSTEDIVRLIPYLKMRKAKIVAIVGNMQSFLSRSADITLNASVEREACPFNLAPTSSTIVALAIGDALAMACLKYNNFSLDDFSRLHPLGQIGRNITLHISDIMQQGDSLPTIMIEASFRDAVIEITNKKLGCVCVVDEKSKLTGIITDGDIRRVLQNYDDIRGLKAREIMTSNPITIKNDAFLSEALALMENRESQLNVLPVLDSKDICVGVVRIHDVIRSGM